MINDWILIGEIVATQGNKGEVRTMPHTEFPDRFGTMDHVNLFRPNSTEPDLVLPLLSFRLHKEFVVLKLKGIDSINEAQTLKGMQIKVGRDEVVPLPEGRNYIFDLIGLDVVTEDDLHLGVISDVLQHQLANDVYVVKPSPGITKLDEILIPVIDDVVLDIDLEKHRVVIHLLDGLLE